MMICPEKIRCPDRIQKGDFTAVKTVQEYFQVKPVRGRQHLLFNLLNFLYFRKNGYDDRLSIESHPPGLFVIIPYILFSEAYFFRQERYFAILKQQIVGVLALQQKVETLYIRSLAVSPFYRKIGLATYMLNYANTMAQQLHKSALELSVLKTNKPALKLYKKSGFSKKSERRRSFILRKDAKST